MSTIGTFFAVILAVIGGWFSVPVALGAFSDPFLSIQLATSPSSGECLTTDGTNNDWASCGSGSGSTFPFTVTGYGVSTSTTVGFLNGFLSTASSTITAPLRLSSLASGAAGIGNDGLLHSFATTTASCAGTTSCTGFTIIGASPITITGAAGSPFPFTPTTNYGVAVNATSTPIWFDAGLMASSTSHFVNASTTLLTANTIYGNTLTSAGTLDIKTGIGSNADINIFGGNGTASVQSPGEVLIYGGNGNGSVTGGGVFIYGGTSGSGANGNVVLGNPGLVYIQRDGSSGAAGSNAILRASSIATSDKTFTFPNWSGTFAIATATLQVSAINSTSTTASSFVGNVGIGTTTPQWSLQIATSTANGGFRPQLTLSDSSVATNNHWSLANTGGTFYLSTSSPQTFATSSVPALTIGANGTATFGNSNATCIGLTGSAGLCDSDDATGATFAYPFPNNATSTALTFSAAPTFSSLTQGWLHTAGGANAITSSTSPTVNYLTATSTTVASTFVYASTTALTVSGNAYFPGSGIWNASGNVGIGTTTPQKSLLIQTGGVSGGQITFDSGGATNRIMALTSSDISVTTAVGNAASLTLNTVGGGNVGIGTTTPQNLLVLQAAASTTLLIANNDSTLNIGQETGELSFNVADVSSYGIVSQISNVSAGTTADFGNLVFSTGSTAATLAEAMRIRSNGNVTIGTSPTLTTTYKLHIAINNTTAPTTAGGDGLTIDNTDTSANSQSTILFRAADSVGNVRHSGAIVMGKESDWTGSYPGYIAFWNRAGAGSETESMRITSGGYVGIGTTTPTWLLNPSSGTAAQLALSAGAGVAQWAMRNAGGNLYFATTTVAGTATSSPSAFTILGNAGSGSVGIASTSPWRTLSVEGKVAIRGLTIAAGTPNSLCINASTKEVTENAALTCTVSARDQKSRIEMYNGSALDVIGKLNPTTFAYNDNLNRLRLGFIADELQAIDPMLADGYDKEGNARSIDQNALIAVLVKGVQELAGRTGEVKTVAVRSVEENWQNAFIGLLVLGFLFQQRQIYKLKKRI